MIAEHFFAVLHHVQFASTASSTFAMLHQEKYFRITF